MIIVAMPLISAIKGSDKGLGPRMIYTFFPFLCGLSIAITHDL